jgi:trimeric autotransporter adhesin
MAYLSTQPTGAPGGGPSPTSCQAAIDDLMSVQTSIASTEQSLANSEADLDHLLGEVYTALEKSAGSGSGSGGTGSGGTGSGGTGSGGTGSGGTGGTGSGRTGSSGGTGGSEGGSGGGTGGSASSGPATAAQLASDQADLDSANAELSEARQNLAAASLAAPISGTVALVNVTSGQQVTGSQGTSTSADFVIEGAGGEEATTTVSVSDVGEIKIGQPATITLDGSATPINGRVDSIGMLSSTSSSGSASYPVTIGLAAGEPTLFAGSDAQVAITLAQVGDAVTVPSSAVEGTGAATFVTVLQAGKPERVRVVVGAAGPVLTQVTSGLTVGEQVVLADLSTPLPTNTNPFAARSLTTGGGGGGFGGARTTGGGAAGRSAAGG